MLTVLRVRNVALITALEVAFDAGLNILSGETGAGKSIIIDSINFVLGERPGKDFIRSGESVAEVEVLITVGDACTREGLRTLGAVLEDDDALLLFRSLNDAGKSVCRVNGRVVTIAMLKQMSALLVDIHGQHEHQSLLNPAKHIELLDRFCGESLEALKAATGESHRAYREIIRQIKAFAADAADKAERQEMYAFQLKELDAADLKAGEEETLLARQKFLNASERVAKAAREALAALDGFEGGDAAIDKLAAALAPVNTLAEIDETQKPFAEAIHDIHARLDDMLRDFKRYCDRLDSDPQELDRVEARLDVISKLKRKYGASVQDVLAHAAALREKLVAMENSEEAQKTLAAHKSRLEKELVRLCVQLTQSRKAAAQGLEKDIEAVLRDLGMKHASFAISVARKKELTPNGFDQVEFMISPNEGEPMKALSAIASGGEMSRVMLALKTALADYDQIETFIFDEIDAGVSGRTAQQVAEKLAAIARARQVLCITHLPQIAAMGDTQFLIEKRTENERTTSSIRALDAAECIQEIARLTSGAHITEAALQAAGELKDMATAYKSAEKV